MVQHQQFVTHVGDKVVVPACDVGEVVAVETLDLDGHEREYFRIRCQGGVMAWVPCDSQMENGIRKVMSVERAEMVFEVVASQKVPERRDTWNRRYRRYREMMLDSRPKVLSQLIGELGAIRVEKGKFSFGERKLYDQVHKLLVNELALALQVDPIDAERRLDEALPQAA